jgi:hypothetical protein
MTDRIRFGELATLENEIAMGGIKNRAVKQAQTVLCLLVFGLLAFQYGDRNGMNDMPFAKVKVMVPELIEAQAMAKQGNIDLFAGAFVDGKDVSLHGELTDANCYLSNGNHAYDHAFCAKFCAAAGSPVLFIADDGGKAYVVLTQKNGVPLPHTALDQLGVPGLIVRGKTLHAHGIDALAVASVGS